MGRRKRNKGTKDGANQVSTGASGNQPQRAQSQPVTRLAKAPDPGSGLGDAVVHARHVAPSSHALQKFMRKVSFVNWLYYAKLRYKLLVLVSPLVILTIGTSL